MKVLKWTLAGVGGAAVAGVLIVSALGLGVTSAQQPGGSGDTEGGVKGFFNRYSDALADSLGISRSELNEKRKAAVDETLDEAVDNGRLTQEQADKIKNHDWGRAGKLVDTAKNALTDIFGAAASTLGMTTEELRTELKDGKSLADIAAEQNVGTDKLKADITAEIDEQLDKAVADGTITQERADAIAKKVAEHIDDVIDHDGPRFEWRRNK